MFIYILLQKTIHNHPGIRFVPANDPMSSKTHDGSAKHAPDLVLQEKTSEALIDPPALFQDRLAPKLLWRLERCGATLQHWQGILVKLFFSTRGLGAIDAALKIWPALGCKSLNYELWGGIHLIDAGEEGPPACKMYKYDTS